MALVKILESNNKALRPYQQEALNNMLKLFLSEEKSISSILSFPTGAGKTYTALNFASNCFKRGYKTIVVVPSLQILYQFHDSIERGDVTQEDLGVEELEVLSIYSGGESFDDVTSETDIILVTYQSLCRNMDKIEDWIRSNKILMIIDEAHHAASLSHRKIINKMHEYNPKSLLLGLTATPYRTSEQEDGLLSQIFHDGIDKNGNPVYGALGIVYKIDKQELINLGYLAKPNIININTDYKVDIELSNKQLNNLYNTDNLPEKVSLALQNDMKRNSLIVDTYIRDKDKYQQTIIFCGSRVQVYALKKMLEAKGVSVGVAISSDGCAIKDLALTKEAVNEDIEKYRKGEIQVILTCQMLDEGFDVPDTKSVFLAMPSTSRRRVDQRVGRGMRYKADDNTFNIVNFSDEWETNIDWVTIDSLFTETGEVGSLQERNKSKVSEVEKCSMSNFTEVMNILEDIYINVSNEEILEHLDSITPVGCYIFDLPTQEKSCTITVLSNAKDKFEKMTEDITEFLKVNSLTGDFVVDELVRKIYNHYFLISESNTVTQDNIKDFISYYIEYGFFPEYKSFDSDFLEEVNLQRYAKKILEKNLRWSDTSKYLSDLFDDSAILKRYYLKKKTFISLVRKTTELCENIES